MDKKSETQQQSGVPDSKKAPIASNQ